MDFGLLLNECRHPGSVIRAAVLDLLALSRDGDKIALEVPGRSRTWRAADVNCSV